MQNLVQKKGLFTIRGVQITLVLCFVADMAARLYNDGWIIFSDTRWLYSPDLAP